MKKKLAIDLIAGAFIILFLYTALNKLYDLASFRAVLDLSPVVAPYARFISLFIPLTEILVVVLLFFPRTQKWGLVLSCGLMAAFSIYVGYMLATSSKLPCSCGGIISLLDWHWHLVVNIGLTLLSLLGVWLAFWNGKIGRKIGASKVIYTVKVELSERNQ